MPGQEETVLSEHMGTEIGPQKSASAGHPLTEHRMHLRQPLRELCYCTSKCRTWCQERARRKDHQHPQSTYVTCEVLLCGISAAPATLEAESKDVTISLRTLSRRAYQLVHSHTDSRWTGNAGSRATQNLRADPCLCPQSLYPQPLNATVFC